MKSSALKSWRNYYVVGTLERITILIKCNFSLQGVTSLNLPTLEMALCLSLPVWIRALPLTSCVTSDKLLNLSVSWFPLLQLGMIITEFTFLGLL